MRGLVCLSLALSGSLSADRKELWQAVFENQEKQALALMEEVGSVKGQDERGVTALGLACENGNARLVAELFTRGASAKTRSMGEPPLLIAARTGSLECVELLLKHGAEVNEAGRGRQTPLMWAAAKGRLEVVQYLLAKGAKFDQALDSGFDALMFAVRAGQAEAVFALLDQGASVTKAYDPKKAGGANMRAGTAPLTLAIENGHLELALELVRRGADPNDQRTGFAPLHTITWVRKTVKGDGPDGIPPPPIDGEVGSLHFVRELVKLGADVNVRVEKGWGKRGVVHSRGTTPFFKAAASGDLPLLKLLHELGADPSLNNSENTTPFLVAAGLGVGAPGEEQSSEEDALAVAQYLLDLGADINHVDKNGETAMHGAVYKASPAMMKFLDEKGADIEIWNSKNKYGWTPLLIAQGFRPGNFRPIQYSEEALSKIMKRRGAETPPSPPPPSAKGY